MRAWTHCTFRWQPGEEAPKKAKVGHSVGKVMATVFWDSRGVLLVRYMPKGTTINAKTYCDVLRDLREAIWCKQPGRRPEDIILLHDNARPHTVAVTSALLKAFKWVIFGGHPPYSPDISPSMHDYYFFPLLKAFLARKRFSTDDELQNEVLIEVFRKLTPGVVCSWSRRIGTAVKQMP